MNDNVDDILDKISQIKDRQRSTISETDAAVNDARRVVRALLDLCGGREMKVTARVGFYPIPPDGTGHEKREAILATYKITSTEIQTEDNLPVDASGDLAKKFLRDCRNGLLERIDEELTRLRSSGDRAF
jgi:hypothetical protein